MYSEDQSLDSKKRVGVCVCVSVSMCKRVHMCVYLNKRVGQRYQTQSMELKSRYRKKKFLPAFPSQPPSPKTLVVRQSTLYFSKSHREHFL